MLNQDDNDREEKERKRKGAIIIIKQLYNDTNDDAKKGSLTRPASQVI